MDAFGVIADPNRRRLIDALRDRESDVGDLITTLWLSQPLVSKHLKVLREAGVVAVRTEGQRRVYRLADDPLPEILAWVNPYHRRWTDGLDRLARLIDEEPS